MMPKNKVCVGGGGVRGIADDCALVVIRVRGQNHPQTILSVIDQATLWYATIRNAKLLTDRGLCNYPCGTQFRYLHLL